VLNRKSIHEPINQVIRLVPYYYDKKVHSTSLSVQSLTNVGHLPRESDKCIIETNDQIKAAKRHNIEKSCTWSIRKYFAFIVI
jgi:hypothetical protein